MISRFQKIAMLVFLSCSLPLIMGNGKLDEAAKKAAKEHDAKVLSAKTVKKPDGRTHEIKMLTSKGVVKTVNVPDKKTSDKSKKDKKD